MKTYILSIVFCLLSMSLFAQRDARIAKNTKNLAQVAQQVMPQQNNEALLAHEMTQRRPGRANHFAVPMRVQYTPDTHGTWETTADGIDVWRLRIYSQKAKSLNLGFTKYVMPKGGSMILYTSDFGEVKGPFTPHDNEEHEQLWTPVLQGDEIVIEVQLPLQNRKGLELEVGAVNHDFVGFQQMASGSCNLDVLCGAADGFPEVDDYRDIIQSVAFMHVNGFANCTGFLVNNTGQDCKPYFMSAYHCDIGAADAPTLVTYWNFQNSYCRQPNSSESGLDGDGLLNTFNSGSTLIASYQPTDFVLVELDDPVVDAADAYFAGWNAEEVLPTRAIAVHHPSNDEKRISFENDNDFYTGTWAGGPDNIPDGDHVVVADWDVGTTEGGSSGSPLFDQNKRVVGQLHGGGAACGNDNYDTYGWFAKSWEGGGTPQTRLKDWLDPNNSGVKTLDGNNCSLALANGFIESCNNAASVSTEVIVGGVFTNNTTLSITDVPSGLMANLSSTNVNPNSSTTLTLSNLSALSSGTYNITISGTDGQESGMTVLALQIYEPNFVTVNLTEPQNFATNVATFANFSWQQQENAQNYHIQVSADNSFDTIIAETNDLASTNYNDILLQPLTTYYWRVRPSNVCGNGNWSVTYQFTTANTACGNYEPMDLPIAISESGNNTYTSTLEIIQEGLVEDVNVVDIIGTHSWVSDLRVTLISPAGTEVLLWQDQCGSEENFDINFDDAATNTTIDCPMTGGNTYQPAGNLSDFNGEQATGTWTLRVEDTANQDGGALEAWTLALCITPDSNLTIAPSSTTACIGETYEFTIAVGAGFGGTVMLTPSIMPTAPFKITYDGDLNNIAPGTILNAMIADFTGIDLGNYTITYTATDGTLTEDASFTFQLQDMPEAAVLMLPMDGASNVVVNPKFEWSVLSGSGYFIQIATDANFTDVVHTASVSGTSYQYPSQLEEFTEYFWQITSENTCGVAVSETFSFTTNDMVPVVELTENQIQVFPNPTTGLVQVQFEKAFQENAQIDIFNINGQRLQQEILGAGAQNTQVDLSLYAKGIYIFKIRTAQGTLSKRIVLQ